MPPALPPARWALTPPFHPCPTAQGLRAVCSLWRFPSGHPGRALPAAVSPWSPDFPRPPKGPRPPGHPRPPYLDPCPQPVNDRPKHLNIRSLKRPPHPRPEPQPHRRQQHFRLRRTVSHCRRCGSRSSSSPPASAPLASAQTARPQRASRLQSNFGPGSALRPGAMSECAITPEGGMPQRAQIASSSPSNAAICGSGNGGKPSSGPALASSIPIERELMSSTPSHDPAPACQARASSGTNRQTSPSSAMR